MAYITTDQTIWIGTDTQWVQFGGMKITATLNSWTLSGSYYADIDITPINSNFASVTLQDSADGTIITPEEIDFTNTTNIRIWMPVNTLTLRATVIG
jgi:hypothetical protein